MFESISISNSDLSEVSSNEIQTSNGTKRRRSFSQPHSELYTRKYKSTASDIRSLRKKGNDLRQLRNQLFSSLAGDTQEDFEEYKRAFYSDTRKQGEYQGSKRGIKKSKLFPSSKERSTWNDDRWNSQLDLMSGETDRLSKVNDRVKEDIALLLAKSADSPAASTSSGVILPSDTEVTELSKILPKRKKQHKNPCRKGRRGQFISSSSAPFTASISSDTHSLDSSSHPSTGGSGTASETALSSTYDTNTESSVN